MYDLTRVTKEFTEVCNKAGIQVTCPIRTNGRLTRTLGRVTHTPQNGVYVNSLVEFSKQLLETATDSSIEAVIKHEAAHYIATARTGEAHGHDAYFRQICAEIGTNNDGTKTKVERTVAEDAIYKYIVSCENCGPIGYYHRMSKNLKDLSSCSCRRCGSHNLTLTQNF